jgi:TP53 regulating kinase-like protein
MGEVGQPFLFKKGAEANLYVADWHGRKVVVKKRLPKAYRPSELDERIRTYRTAHEPQHMHEAKMAGVSTPTIFLVDIREATIIMEYIEGKQIKQLLSKATERERESLCFKVGESIGMLHEHGLIHGDLTTSNIILNPKAGIYFVDFGLGDKNKELEARGTDLHLMKRALQSTHFQFAAECFKAVIKGYTRIVGADQAKRVLDKIKEIEKRGRYVAERRETND